MVFYAIAEYLAPIIRAIATRIGARLASISLRGSLINIGRALGITSVEKGVERISIAALISKALSGARDTLFYLCFSAFILEESIQAAGIAVWTAIRNNDFETAKEALKKYVELIEFARDYIDMFVDPIPIIGDAFSKFVEASLMQAQTYEKLIEKGISEGVRTYQRVSGGVYAFGERD